MKPNAKLKPIIEFKDFTFKYRAQTEPTLNHITLSIYPGEKVLILGASGSGKSTLAHCINGLVPFSYGGEISGEYYIDGQKPSELGIFGLSQIVGTVLQDTDGQFVGITVAEDIAFGLENNCLEQERMKQKVDETAELVDVKKLLLSAPRELSGGQKQRVSMAGVMVGDAKILLFDEPLANLDPATGKRAIDLIDRIQKQKAATILIIEHRLEDALYRDVDRIIVIGDGRIVADAPPDSLLSENILEAYGIRKPLYLSALEYAGCTITAESKPQHIETMKIDDFSDKVQKWAEKVQIQKRSKQDEKILEVEHLNFSYLADKPVLQDIHFSVQRGEILSIVGKNGAGKSTLSALICGFHHPNSGRILYDGKDMAQQSIKERGEHIGLVMQNPNHMISKAMIYDEVALGLLVRKVPKEEIKERVDQTLHICGLYPYRNWPISALSFGQKKRVTIASILVLNPEVLILDEPTAGQDYKHYTEIMEFIRALNEKEGITIIMITHDMHLMLEYTDRAIVIADGKMISDDIPARILTDQAIADQAYLKKTSLFDLALKCNIQDPVSFVERFISYERQIRREV